MSNTSPNFGYWRQFSTIKIWNLAAMMNDIDPNVMGDVIDKNGDATDLSDDVQRVISASLVGDITAYPIHGQLPTATTEVSVASLDKWLRVCGYVDLADALDTQLGPTGPPASPATVQSSVGIPCVAPTHATSNGTAVVWTAERKLEARTMRDNEKGRGNKAYTATTAKKYGVSTARLRAVLADEPQTGSVKKPGSSWHP